MTPITVRRWLMRAALALSLCGAPVPRVSAWFGDVFDDAEQYVASLTSPTTQHALGLKDAHRPDEIVNRLEVTFQESTTPSDRFRILQQIGRDFLWVLFSRQRIPTATVVEGDADGRILNTVVVNMVGTPPTAPTNSAVRRGSC